MNRLAVMVVMSVAACGKDEPRGSTTRITYDVDLDAVVTERAEQLAHDLRLAAPGTTVRVGAGGVISAAASDPIQVATLEATLKETYRDQIEPRACAEGAPGTRCFAIAPAVAETIKQAALARTAKTVALRLDAMKLASASATPRGTQLVVELRGTSAEVLAAMRSLIPRGGRLEITAVDDGTPVMRRVLDKVGSETREGEAIDPEARAAGIRGGTDEWRVDPTGQIRYDYYLLGPERRSLERYFARLAEADPAYAIAPDRALAFEAIDPERPGGTPRWRSYVLERRPALTGAAVVEAEATFDERGSRPVVRLELSRDGAARFAEVTTRLTGKKLAIVLDGIVKSAPIISGPISGGQAWITLGGADVGAGTRDAQDLAFVLRSGALPAPLREASIDVVP